MLNLTLSNCPVSWGIEEAEDPRNTPWPTVLDEMAAAGYRRVELGPPGYFPADLTQLRNALDGRDLTLSAGYVLGHYGTKGAAAVDLDAVRATCQALAGFERSTLIVMEEMNAKRDATSGRSDDAERLTEAGWERLLGATHSIAEIATAEFGLDVAFHPHVATHVEFDDEIDRYFSEADSSLMKLCLDTGHSVWADVDPVGVLERHGSRLRYLHLKDVNGSMLKDARTAGVRFEDAVDKGVFCPVGSGIVDFVALGDRLDALEFQGDAAVEQDRTPGRIAGALEDAQASMRFLCEHGWSNEA